MNTFKKISSSWHALPMASRLVVVNIIVFAVLGITGVVMLFTGDKISRVVDMLALSSSLDELGRHPWTPLTYMFTQYDVVHIIFNMLTLYWFGKLFSCVCHGARIVWLYLIGGLTGALAFVVVAQFAPMISGSVVGSSAAVMAIVIAAAVLMPNYELYLLLFGAVKLKWVALIAIGIFSIGLAYDNAGGHVAHFGGVLAGALYALAYKRGFDVGGRLNRRWTAIIFFFRGLFFRVRRRRVLGINETTDQLSAHKRRASNVDDRRQLDQLLDKIKRSGYSSLSADERRRLYEVSKRVK